MNIQLKLRLEVIKSVLSIKGYVLLFIILILLYVAANVLINQFYVVLPVFFSYRLSLVIPYVTVSIAIGIVAALNITLVVYKFRQAAAIKKETGTTALGIFGGMLGGACPGCFVGLLPTLTGVFGVSLTLSVLPFLGFELTIPALVISLIALYIISNPLTCKVKI